MSIFQKLKIRSNSRQQIAIKGVEEDILILPTNEYRALLSIAPLNFELRSEAEQDAIIDTYESFLNSIGSPLQILVQTREMDMDTYLDDITVQLQHETEAIYQSQLQHYGEFVRSLITTNKILTRHFYIIVPFKASKNIDLELVKNQLHLQCDIVAKGMGRLGMQTRRLTNLEILDLFYSFYSPRKAKIQPLTEQALQLVHTALTTKEVVHG